MALYDYLMKLHILLQYIWWPIKCSMLLFKGIHSCCLHSFWSIKMVHWVAHVTEYQRDLRLQSWTTKLTWGHWRIHFMTKCTCDAFECGVKLQLNSIWIFLRNYFDTPEVNSFYLKAIQFILEPEIQPYQLQTAGFTMKSTYR